MESELFLQFLPEPIHERIILNYGAAVSDQRLRFINNAVQTLEISEQEHVVNAERAPMPFALQKVNCSVDVPLRQRSHD